MAILIALLTVLINVLGPPITIFATTRWVGRRVPGVRVAPQTLTDYSVSTGATTALSYFGYDFEVPWNAAFKAKGGNASIVQLQFDSGQSLTFIVPANQDGLLSEIVQDRSLNYLQSILGDLTKRSAYDQYATLLSITPQTVRSFGRRAQAVRGSTLLTIKAIAIGPGLATGVFSFKFADKRGFEIGDPQKSKRVDLEVFGMGGHHVEMLLFATKDSARLSQSEINRILTSLHSDSAGSTVSAAHFTAPPSDRNP
ncbi:MAG: hypothetical protein WB627_05205 [Candidatus Acidiferrum sp.]